MHVIEGLFLGFASILLVGPVVFVLINASVYQGVKSGIAVAIGIILGDIIFAVVSYKGLKLIIENETFNQFISYIGFLILFFLGLSYLLKKQKIIIKKTKKRDLIKNFFSGFSINFFNPFVLIIWLSVINYSKVNYPNNSISFLIAVVFGIFFIDIVKVFLSKKIKQFVQSKKLELFYKISGVIMLLFSFRIFWFLIFK